MSGNRDGIAGTDDRVDADESDGFLGRWSRRKAQARRGELPPDPDEVADARPEEDAAAVAEAETPPLDEAADEPRAPRELPSLDSLDEHSDYSMFMAADVDPDARRDALRKLFRSPKFNIRDGLDDYDEDYSSPEPLGNIVTAEMRWRMRAEMERLLTQRDDGDDEVVAAAASAANEEPSKTADIAGAEAPDESAEPDDDDDRTATS